jgi:diguanylate cyclase (GGDEF)-like protein
MTADIASERQTTGIERILENERTLNAILRTAVRDAPLERLLHDCLDILLGVSWLSILPKGGIFVAERDRKELLLVAQRNLAPELLTLCARVPFGRCLCGRAARTGELQHASCVDHRHENRYPGMPPHGHYNVPVLYGGEVLGVLVLYLPHGHPADPAERQFLLAVADVLALVIRNRQIRDELERTCRELAQMAVTDPLTGLYNRRHFFAELERAWSEAVRVERPLALILCDIDHFKQLNDRFGHHVGDEVLKRVADVLRSGIRAYDTVARLGGEEFGLLLPATGLDAASAVAERLRATIADTPIRGEGHEIRVTASLGVACRRAASDPHELMRRCDRALYRAKERGRNHVVRA